MNYQTKFLLKKGILVAPKHLRVKSVFTEIENLPSQRTQKFASRRRNAIVPVPPKDDIASESTPSKPYREIKCYQSQDVYHQEVNEKEYQEDQNYRKIDYLRLHKISMQHAQMLMDWVMMQIKRYQRMSLATLFLSVELLDQFLSCTKGFIVDDLQLIGSCCIFLASKFLDLYPITVEDVFVDICSEQYTIHDFLQMEQTVCKKLHYNLLYPTPYDYLEKLFSNLQPYISEFYEDGEIANMKHNALDLLQYAVIGYEFRHISHYNKAIACIYETIKHTDKRLVLTCINQIQSLLVQLNHIELNFNQIQLNASGFKQFQALNSQCYQSINNYFY